MIVSTALNSSNCLTCYFHIFLSVIRNTQCSFLGRTLIILTEVLCSSDFWKVSEIMRNAMKRQTSFSFFLMQAV